jgi:prepilin-type N-terminal cleavage/methylation domain-containing protein
MTTLSFLKQSPVHKGFTLIETLIAIAVLSLAVTGPMTIAQKSLSSAMYARDQITAYYLAQDAIEYVRNVRDSNRLHRNNGNPATDWLTGGANGLTLSECILGSPCVINTNLAANESDAIRSFVPGNDRLYFDPVTSIYSHQNVSGSIATQFSRQIIITQPVLGREADISVAVSWKPNTFSAVRKITETERIFNF